LSTFQIWKRKIDDTFSYSFIAPFVTAPQVQKNQRYFRKSFLDLKLNTQMFWCLLLLYSVTTHLPNYNKNELD